MHTRNLWPALLLVAAAACTEGGSPVDTPWERSFDIAMPTLRQLSSTPEVAQAPPTDSLAASFSYNPADLPPEYRQVLASGRLITEPSDADVGFTTDHRAVFGQALGRSRGSYYKNSIKLQLRYQGSVIAENSGETAESCLCAHFWSPWGEIANTTIGVESSCGHSAQANSQHEARLEFRFASSSMLIMLESGTDSDQAQQAPCGNGSGPGGGGDDDGVWYICFWEDTYSAEGVYLGRTSLGCQLYNGQVS